MDYNYPINLFTSADDEDYYSLYNLLEEISTANSLKNCLNFLGGYVALSPKNIITEKLANMLAAIFYSSIFFENDEQINLYVKTSDYDKSKVPHLCFAISFTSAKSGDYAYSLRFHQADPVSEVFETDQPWRTHPFRKEWISKLDKYQKFGFLTIKTWVDNLILKEETKSIDANITTHHISVKTPSYYEDVFPLRLQGRVCIFNGLAFMMTFLKLIFAIMYEKEKKIKEGMKMIGMNEAAFYCSWVLTYFLIFLILSFINSVLLKIFIYTYSNYFFVLIIQVFCSISLILHGLLITVFFSKSKTAVLAGAFLLFVEYLFVQLVRKNSLVYTVKAFASLSPVIALSFASDIFLEMEASEIGINFDNYNVMVNNYSILTAMMFFLISSGIFLLLFIYFEQVFPNEFGKKKSPFFFISWCWGLVKDCRKKVFPLKTELSNNKVFSIKVMDSPNLFSESEFDEIKGKNFEEVERGLLQQNEKKTTVHINRLSKVFSTGKVAVHDFSCTMYNNQIFVLLGIYNIFFLKKF